MRALAALLMIGVALGIALSAIALVLAAWVTGAWR